MLIVVAVAVVADVVVAVPHPVLLVEVVPVVHGLDLHHAPLAVHLLDRAEHDLVRRLAALLVEGLRPRGVLPVLLQVVHLLLRLPSLLLLLLVVQLLLWRLPVLLLLVIGLLLCLLPVLLLLVAIDLVLWLLLRAACIPAAEIRLPMPDVVSFFRLCCHDGIVLTRCRYSCVQRWRSLIIWDGIAFLHWPRVGSSLLVVMVLSCWAPFPGKYVGHR